MAGGGLRHFDFRQPTRGIEWVQKGGNLQADASWPAGKAILMISSDLPELMGVCDRAYVMRGRYHLREILRKDFTQEAILDMAVS